MGEFGSGLSNIWAPMVLVAELLPGWNTLLQTLSTLRADPGVVGVVGVIGVVGVDGIDNVFCNLLPSPASSTIYPIQNNNNYLVYL